MLIVRNNAKLVLFALCLFLASVCNAIGFGDLKVYSYLNEPLVAEISLTGFKDMDAGLLKANLADAKDFVRAGIDRPYFLTYLVFEVLSYQNQLIIVVRTTKPVQVPYLEFLVELSWPDGNLIKDYTVLLDPPPANLSKETRPKALSQIAEQSLSKNFGPDAIQQQLDKQKAERQRAAAAADLSGVVKLAPNSFSDNTFDSDLPQKDTALVPSEVPDIDDEAEQAAKAAAAQQAAKVAQEATEAAYQKQLAAFKQQEQEKAAAAAKQKAPTILGKVVDQLEDFDSLVDSSTIESQPSTHEAAQSTNTVAAEPTVHPEEPIDFQHVLPPVPSSNAALPNTNPNPVEPVAPTYQPATDIKPVSETGNHLYLGIILSLLLIAVGIAIAVKRMHDSKAHNATTSEPALDPKVAASAPADFEEFTMHEEDVSQASVDIPEVPEEPEEIELTTPIDSGVDTGAPGEDSPNKFDREFDKIDLSELATPVVEEAVMTAESTITSEASITPEPSATSGPTMRLEPLDNTPHHVDKEDTITIEPPTMFKTSGLTLEPEGVTLIKPMASIIDNSDAVQTKLDLAKEYLDTGDKESAKELLQEIIEIANDSQRLEAQMLLSSIV